MCGGPLGSCPYALSYKIRSWGARLLRPAGIRHWELTFRCTHRMNKKHPLLEELKSVFY